jgi:hypothetical protein
MCFKTRVLFYFTVAGLNVSGFEPEEVVLEPEPEPDGLPELRVENVVSRIRSLVANHYVLL